jgi:hypothetical protein
VNLQRAAYAALGLLGLIWIAAMSFGLRKLDQVQPTKTPSGPSRFHQVRQRVVQVG